MSGRLVWNNHFTLIINYQQVKLLGFKVDTDRVNVKASQMPKRSRLVSDIY